MAMTADDIAAAANDAAIPDMTKLLRWAQLNLERQAAAYAQAAAKANQVSTIASTNADIEAKQRVVEDIDAQITELLS
jgi:hypothetical protein